jgi:hypothetical protein
MYFALSVARTMAGGRIAWGETMPALSKNKFIPGIIFLAPTMAPRIIFANRLAQHFDILAQVGWLTFEAVDAPPSFTHLLL